MRNKTCSKCKLVKPTSCFHRNRHKKDGFQSACKACKKKLYYEPNKKDYIRRGAESSRQRKARIQQWLFDYLAAHPCVDCGELDPIVLEFHHRDSSKKVECISTMLHHGFGEQRIVAEVAKCDVRCANCHHRQTAKERDWYRFWKEWRTKQNGSVVQG